MIPPYFVQYLEFIGICTVFSALKVCVRKLANPGHYICPKVGYLCCIKNKEHTQPLKSNKGVCVVWLNNIGFHISSLGSKSFKYHCKQILYWEALVGKLKCLLVSVSGL